MIGCKKHTIEKTHQTVHLNQSRRWTGHECASSSEHLNVRQGQSYSRTAWTGTITLHDVIVKLGINSYLKNIDVEKYYFAFHYNLAQQRWKVRLTTTKTFKTVPSCRMTEAPSQPQDNITRLRTWFGGIMVSVMQGTQARKTTFNRRSSLDTQCLADENL